MIHNKKKIFNDPVYGFITIPDELHFDLIEHPYFQRLRRIKQLGLTHLVYPGALHTRFHHSLGAMHLMQQALQVLKSKGHFITPEETQAASIAILLHDIGHGPYSHALEHSIIHDISHERLSSVVINQLNQLFKGQLNTAVQIFEGTYNRKFLCKLVSSQLDMDRLDYLKRDSFFTGVAEGTVNADRLITMLDVHDDNLVIEAKGIYSVEKFLIARRLMYWQVYLHKTVLSAEYMLTAALKRAKQLAIKGVSLFTTPAMRHFIYHDFTLLDLVKDPLNIKQFMLLDDFDVFTALKIWMDHDDFVLSFLSQSLVNRNLFRIELSNQPKTELELENLLFDIKQHFKITSMEAEQLLINGTTSNHAYHRNHDSINILLRNGSIQNISEASDQLNISVLSSPVTKYFTGFPKFQTRNST